MFVDTSTRVKTFFGEDGGRLSLRPLPSSSPGTPGTVELSLEHDDHFFRATLGLSEAIQLCEFLGHHYRNATHSFLAFNGQQGERLTFRHSNMGEPYREGVEVRVENVEGFPDYLGPFIDCSDFEWMRKLLPSQ